MSSDDADLFVAFYRAEYPGMVRLAHAVTGSDEDAEDIVQDAFARLQTRLATIDNPGGYLRNSCSGAIRINCETWSD